ncbi:hypothetical protein ACFQY7_01440 [Actinomadura luteofluorescens]|uniref:hypothetical protein n=1 Tax=Actinomadura luteofluorescens TaxID=46163 RepID=UPI00362CEE96
MAVGTHGESFMETDPRHPTRPGAAAVTPGATPGAVTRAVAARAAGSTGSPTSRTRSATPWSR